MKKLLLTVVGLMAFSGFSFADDTEVNPRGERVVQEERDKIEYKEKMTDVLENFAPELLEAYNGLWADHEAIHVQLTVLKENTIAEKKIEKDTFKEEMKALIQAEEMTREDAKVIFEEIKATNLANREALKIEIETLKASYGLSKDNFKALNQTLRTLVEEGNAVAINGHLNTMLDYLSNHVAFDFAKYDFLNQ